MGAGGGAGFSGLVGLLSALLWGGGDFCGGMGARRMDALRVVLVSHGASFLVLVLLALGTHAGLPDQNQFLWGVTAGIAGGIALMSFYTALSLGHMGSSAALSGLLAAALPVVVALRTEGFPGWLRMGGFLLAAVAIWLIAGSSDADDAKGNRRAMALALVAGAGFGVFLVAIKYAGDGGVVWALVSARVGSLGTTLLAMLWVRFRPGHARPAGHGFTGRGLRWALIASTLDTSGNLLYIVATRVGRLDVAAVLGSLYPASTMLLAAWMLRERPTRRQALGMGAALAAVVAITAN
ncbi:MAG: EamA family transporter [Acidobacteriaceae bacterium]